MSAGKGDSPRPVNRTNWDTNYDRIKENTRIQKLLSIKDKKERMRAILDDTVEYYSEDTSRRCFEPGYGCFYRSEGKKCAIGRFIPDENYSLEMEEEGATTIISRFHNCLPPEIEELPSKFLGNLQFFHDNAFNWGEEGLTGQGKESVEFLKKEIDNFKI